MGDTYIVPVVKRNQTVRICGDFKTTVNPVLKVDQYPLPRIEDIFASLAGGQKFSKLDLRQAYLQCEVEEESRKLSTINTHRGLYTYNRLVFGIASAPAIWQRAIDQVLQGVPNVQCILDDMIITGKNDQDHLKTLETVFEILKCFGLRVNKVLGQNVTGQNVTDKMSRTKCRGQNVMGTKCHWTKCRGQNAVDKMWWSKCRGQNVVDTMSWTKCRGPNVVDKMSWSKCRGQNVVDEMSWSICSGKKCSGQDARVYCRA